MAAPSPNSRLRPRSLRTSALALTTIGALVLCLPWSWVDAAELIALDLRIRVRAKLQPSREPACAIVGIDDSSFTIAERAPDLANTHPVLGLMQPAWPWDRRVFAETVRRLRGAGARLIVFDIVFAQSTEADIAFAAALAEPGAPVVLASHWQVSNSALGEASAVLIEPQLDLLEASGERVGFANVWPDEDGVLRRATTTLRPEHLLGMTTPDADDGSAGPSLAMAAARELQPGVVAPARGLIDFRQDADDLPIVPIENLFLPDRWNGPWLDHGELFRDRVIWIGPLSEIHLKDVHHTSLGRRPGVEAQVQTFASIIRGDLLPPSWPGWRIISVVLMATGGVLTTQRNRRTRGQVNVLVLGTVGWIGLSLAAFVAFHTNVPLFAPTVAWIGGSGMGVIAQLSTEQRERRRLRSMLGRYVSEEVAQRIADQPDDFSQALRGERRMVTVLFADLRGFTSWVEDAEPEEFVAQLNEYFTAIVDCVLAHGGTLQKFIGDAVLAAWGDTRSDGATADCTHAVAAALDMQAALEALNQRWNARPGNKRLRLGIGIHHGTVMLGNVGHPRRMEFTVMGDAVNIAARLESANRQLETELLVSDTVRDGAAASFNFLPIGPILLKGRREPVGVFVPLSAATVAASAWEPFARAAQTAWEQGDAKTARARWQRAAAEPGPLIAYFAFRRANDQAPAANGVLTLDAK